ncbi:MAG: hypothetical protein WA728_03000 [Xanthobacteraceae bacterium]
MNIFDFITQEELDDLPDLDPQLAFPYFKTGKGMHARLNRETVQPLTEVPDPLGAEAEAEPPPEIRST